MVLSHSVIKYGVNSLLSLQRRVRGHYYSALELSLISGSALLTDDAKELYLSLCTV